MLQVAILDNTERLLNPPVTRYSLPIVGGSTTDAYKYFNGFSLSPYVGPQRNLCYSADHGRLYIGADPGSTGDKTAASLRLSDMSLTVEDSAGRGFVTIAEDVGGYAWGIGTVAGSLGLWLRTGLNTWSHPLTDTDIGHFYRNAAGLYYQKYDGTWYALANGSATLYSPATPSGGAWFSNDKLGDVSLAPLAYGYNLVDAAGNPLLTPGQVPALALPNEMGGFVGLSTASLKINATYSLVFANITVTAAGYTPFMRSSPLYMWLVNKTTPAMALVPGFSIPTVPSGSGANQTYPLPFYAQLNSNGGVSVWFAGNVSYSATASNQIGGVLRQDMPLLPNI